MLEVWRNNDVVGLDVAVNDALFVRMMKCGGELVEPFPALMKWNYFISIQYLAKGVTLDVLKNDFKFIVLKNNVINRRDTWMRQGRQCLRFSPETLFVFRQSLCHRG